MHSDDLGEAMAISHAKAEANEIRRTLNDVVARLAVLEKDYMELREDWYSFTHAFLIGRKMLKG